MWHLPNGTTLTANDSTSNANNGTITGATATTGQVNGAGSFDGAGDFVSVGSAASLNITSAITLSVWIKLNYTMQTIDIILDKIGEIYALQGSQQANKTKIQFALDTSDAGPNNLDTTTQFTTQGVWYYITGTYDGSTQKIYVNGVLENSIARTGTITTNSNNFRIGGYDTSSGYDFNGTIDEPRISSSAHSAAWIAASYKSESDSFNTFNTEEERYVSSGTLTSSIFDTEQSSNWGTLTYNTDGVATTTVKARTSNSSSMTGATDFATCNAITSGTDISSNNCVTDTHRYIQYQVSLTSVSANTPIFQDVSIAFTASDSTPPSISLTALSPDPNNDNTPSLTGTTTDAAGTVSNVQFQMDGISGSWTACTADDGSFNSATEAFTCNVSSALSDGLHTIYVRATDSNGNTTSDVNASTDTFTIDATAPSIPGTPSTTTPTNNNKPTWTWTASTDSGVGLSLTIPYSVQWCGNSSYTGCASNTATSTTNSYTHSSALTDGTWYFKVKATDAVNNSSSYSSNGSVVVDTAAPTISVTALSPDPNSNDKPSISGTATDATTNLTAIQYQMDSTSGSWSSCTANDGTIDSTSEAFTCTIGMALSDGSHTIYIRATDSVSNTTAQVNYGTDTFTIDAGAPSVSLTAISPDPGTNTKPTISGTATDTTGTITNVQFQVDSTSGSWISCTAGDGSFNSSSESFSCAITTALSDGTHTIYVRATDNASNNSSNASDSFTVDTTAPASFDLDSPGDNSYTNSERPSFKWKATSDATSGLSKYSIEVDNGDSGDFSIDDIPTSRTTDYETNKYIAHYENFSDSDSTNNYISVYTKSTNDWGSDNNDGKLKEGKRSWKVKATDNAGNERSESRTLFVDRTSPSVEVTQINDTKYSSNGFTTNDKTPTIYGKITDSLVGDKTDNKVSAGPKNIEVKIEKKNNLGLYDLQTLATVNLNETYWTSDISKITDNSQNKSDKYSTFEFTPQTELPLGNYRVIITGKDNADNSGNAGTFYLNIVTYEQITTPEEKKIVEEGIKPLTPEQKEKVKQELEITKPTEPVKPTALEKTVDALIAFRDNLFHSVVNLAINIAGGISKGVTIAFNGIGQGAKFIFDTTGQALAFAGDKTGKAIAFVGLETQKIFNGVGQGLAFTRDRAGEVIAFVGKTTSSQIAALYNSTQSILAYVGQGIQTGASAVGQGLAFAGEKIGGGISSATQTMGTLLATIGQGVSNTGKAIGNGYNQLANNAPGVAKTILTGIGNGVSTTGKAIANATNTVATTTVKIAQSTTSAIGIAANSIATTTSTIAQNTTKTIGTIATNTGNVISNVSKSIASTTSTVAQNTSKTTGTIAKTIGNATQKTGSATSNVANAIAGATQNTVKATKSEIANIAFAIGERTQGVAGDFSLALIQFAYNFVPEPTKISDVQMAIISPTSVKVSWKTNHPANGKVNYGLDETYPHNVQSEKRLTHHEFTITNLKPDTQYYFEVMSHNKNYVYDANRKFKTPAK